MKLQPLVSLWQVIPYLVAALAFAGWQLWRIRRNRATRKDRKVIKRWARRGALLALPAIIALGPSVQGGVSSPGVANLDVIYAVDVTPSMGALDYAGKQQRLAGVKQDLLALSGSLQGAHQEIITFDTGASIIVPLTTDATVFSTAVDGMTPQIGSYSQGSSIDRPINLIAQELKASQSAFPDHKRLLFYLGDGEQTAASTVQSFAPIARYLDGGAVLGYGTTKGAQMIKYTGGDTPAAGPGYVTTVDTAANQLVPAVSHMSPAALQKIASQLKLSYQDRNQGGPASDIYQASKAALAVDRSQRVVHYLNLYWVMAIPFAALVFWEWQSLVVRLFDLRERHGGRRA